MIILGIDPGANGGLAWLGADGSVTEIQKMPPTPMDIYEALNKHTYEGVICYIEQVGQGMPGQSSKATATFARHVGHLEMALLAHGVPAIWVTPGKWQKKFALLGAKGESKVSHKNRIKKWAQGRFPREKITLWNADALALAEYGRLEGGAS